MYSALHDVITSAGPYQIEPYLTLLQPYCHEPILQLLSRFRTLRGDARRDQHADCFHSGLILRVEAGEVRAIQIEHGEQLAMVEDRHDEF